jgi:hypothetical protein
MSKTFLLIVEPVALINGSGVRMIVTSLAMGLIVEPVAAVYVP